MKSSSIAKYCVIKFKLKLTKLISSSEPSIFELMGLEPASVRPSVRACVHTFKHEYLITTKFYLKHHWGGGKAAGFDAEITLVSMATDSSHRVIMGKRASSRFLDCF